MQGPLLAVVMLALTACATQSPRPAAATLAPEMDAAGLVSAPASAAGGGDAFERGISGRETSGRETSGSETSGSEASGSEALAGDSRRGLNPDDPWEGFNRSMHAFNDVFDRFLLRPMAKGYTKITPGFLRKGVSNFFGNLQQPVSALNLLLQGHPVQAGSALGRFSLNVLVGLGGLLDPASEVGLPRRSSDFGQTFAKWGWSDSRYLVLPVFGPGTVRDSFGKGVNSTISPVSWLAKREGAEISLLYGLDARAAALPYESFLEGAHDPYLMIRDAYLQRRRCQITDCSTELPDYLMPDYEFEVPDFETLRR